MIRTPGDSADPAAEPVEAQECPADGELAGILDPVPEADLDTEGVADVEGAATGPIERPKAPKCPICHGSLHFGNEWHCPTCGFRYQVDRGKVGPPLWGGMTEPEPEEKEEYDESMQEAFMDYLLSGGWTEESYEKLSERAKHELFEKWKEIAGF